MIACPPGGGGGAVIAGAADFGILDRDGFRVMDSGTVDIAGQGRGF